MTDMADTIAAIATARGAGGIAIVRVSGDRAEAILSALFVPARAKAPFESHRMMYGRVMAAYGETLDEVMAVYRDFAHPGYYARMGAAWGLATLYLSRREEALAILRDGVWDPRTHNMAIRKLIESCRVDAADKAALRALRRRENEA